MSEAVSHVYAQQSPTQSWVSGWLEFLQANLPVIYWSAVFVVAMLIMIRKGNKKKRILGGVKGAVVFGIASAFVYLILTNVPGFADLFGEELPIDAQ